MATTADDRTEVESTNCKLSDDADTTTMLITDSEAALYDRQIRLWGVAAQNRLRKCRLLVIGARGLSAEVCKNLVLAGIKSLTLLDNGRVTEEDFVSQFLLPLDSIGQNRAQASLERIQILNPNVDVKFDSDEVQSKSDDYFRSFDAVIATDCHQKDMIRINECTHETGVPFFSGDVFGYYGYLFIDLIDHQYIEETPRPKNNQQPIKHQKEMKFCKLKESFSHEWRTDKLAARNTSVVYFILQVLLKFRDLYNRFPNRATFDSDLEQLLKLRSELISELEIDPDTISEDYFKFCPSQLSPVCAIVGGILAQEVIKAITHQDQPINNYFLYNGVDDSGLVELIN